MKEKETGPDRNRLFIVASLIGILAIAAIVIIFVISPFSDSGESESAPPVASGIEEVIISTVPQEELPAMPPDTTGLEETPPEWKNPAQGGTFTIPAILRFTEGEVIIERDGESTYGYDRINLYPGDLLEIKDGTTAIIRFFEGSISVLEGPSKVEIVRSEVTGKGTDAYASVELQLDVGNVLNKVGDLFTGRSSHKVSTANTIAGAWGTIYQVIVSPEGITLCKVSEGEIKTAYIGRDAEGKSGAFVTTLKAKINNTIEIPAIKPDMLPTLAKNLGLLDQDPPAIRKHLASLLRQKIVESRDTGISRPTSSKPATELSRQFQGTVTVNGEPVPDGTVIKAIIGSTEVKSVRTIGSRYSIDLGSEYANKDVILMVNDTKARTVTYQMNPEKNIDLEITTITPKPTHTTTSDDQPPKTTDNGGSIISQPALSPSITPKKTSILLPGEIIYVTDLKDGQQRIRKGPHTQNLTCLQPDKGYWIYAEQDIVFASLQLSPGWNFIIWREPVDNIYGASEAVGVPSNEIDLTLIQDVIENYENVPVLVLHLGPDKSTAYLHKSPLIGDILKIGRDQGYYVHADWSDLSKSIHLSGADLIDIDPYFEN